MKYKSPHKGSYSWAQVGAASGGEECHEALEGHSGLTAYFKVDYVSQTWSFLFFSSLYHGLSSPVLTGEGPGCQFFAWNFSEFSSMEEVSSSKKHAWLNEFTPLGTDCTCMTDLGIFRCLPCLPPGQTWKETTRLGTFPSFPLP